MFPLIFGRWSQESVRFWWLLVCHQHK